jgi:ABC-type nickel/cobalt efflux system permease component RcnA
MGMGVAGGLVPSPSALIVLLSAIALGRTWFGIVLVIGYGVGMAVVLTLAGLLLVGVRNRLRQHLGGASGRISAAAQRWTRLVPMLTALLVLVVGAGLAIRSITTI